MSPRSNRHNVRDTIIRKVAPMTLKVLGCTREEAIIFLCKLSSEERDGILKLYTHRAMLKAIKGRILKEQHDRLRA